MIAILLPTVTAARAESAPANSLRELYAALGRCIKAPPAPSGSELTIMFSIKRDGALLGVPRMTHRKLQGDLDRREQFVASVIESLRACLPAAITEGLGSAVAGRRLYLRYSAAPRNGASRTR